VTHGLSFETRSSNAPQDEEWCLISISYLMLSLSKHEEPPPFDGLRVRGGVSKHAIWASVFKICYSSPRSLVPPKQALSLAAFFTILPVRLDVKDRESGGDDG
jgi:hypothetical protein